MGDDEINRSIIYDKLYIIEGWAHRCRKLVEVRFFEKAKCCIPYIEDALKETKVLLKIDEEIKVNEEIKIEDKRE